MTEVPDVGKIIIRPSMLADYAACGRRAAASLFREDFEAMGFTLRKMQPHIAGSLGTAVHKVVARLLKDKMKGIASSFKDVLAEGIAEFDKETKNGVTTDDTTPNADTAYKQIMSIARMYAIRVLPQHQPKAVEVKVSYSLGDNYFLQGTFDSYDTADIVHDLKTGSRDNNYKYQVGAYVLGLKEAGEKPQAAQIDHIARTSPSAKKGQAEPTFERIDAQEASIAAYALAHRIKADHQFFKSSGSEWAFTADPSTNLCKEKYCSAWGTPACTLWRNK